MALYLLRALLENQITAESRDRIVFGWHVDAAAQPTALQLINAIAVAQGGVGAPGIIQADYVWDTAQVYDVLAKGAPVDESLFGGSAVANTGTAGPQEVNVVVTRWINDGLGRPFKIGRRYMGPISGTWLNGNRRLPANLMTTILDWEQTLYDEFALNGWTPVVDTKGALHVVQPIVGLSVDNAWDTQRRRGVDPSDEVAQDLDGAPLG